MDYPGASESGIVFSGGGVRGMAHIGLVKALREHDITPQWVAGSSVGALVGAMYADDISIDGMLSFFKETPLFRYNFFSISKPGFIDTDRYHKLFEAYWPANSFEALKRRLYVAATNLNKGQEAFFQSGELIRPLLASAALPPIFSPVKMGNTLYADGGIMNNFPLEPIAPHCRYVIGSNVAVIGELGTRDIRSSLQLTNRTTALMIYAINRDKIQSCNLIFEPPELERIGVLDKKGIERAYRIGYEHAMRVLGNPSREPQGITQEKK
ncbi:patatin-like phospholipase family protein [Robiginitalea sp. SC105]|uniref:patatin-like phospholipase family protein n=1 Tax=Robiginitalea sp. SC105 TaxID=2762332 RepID=UPI00163AA3B4|nr:patatin-like phospholipase family protein [Robiginitalea sp. SC105]MBC2838253.1 patatin-like phospholipase family protein [Robiginitalea sp. SC105]